MNATLLKRKRPAGNGRSAAEAQGSIDVGDGDRQWQEWRAEMRAGVVRKLLAAVPTVVTKLHRARPTSWVGILELAFSQTITPEKAGLADIASELRAARGGVELKLLAGNTVLITWEELIEVALQEVNSKAQKIPNGIPAGATSTTTPAGIARNDPAAETNETIVEENHTVARKNAATAAKSETAELVRLPLAQLADHPANPDPTEAEIVQMMEWLGRGQDEPITVRPSLRHPDWHQVLAGRTRCTAARRLGWTEIECRVRYDLADEKTAVTFMAASNAQRREEHPIRQALMLQALLGAGVEPAVAGQLYGLEKEDSVRNKIRLLKLSKEWQQRIISREVPESVGRMLVPYVEHASLMKAFEKDYHQSWTRARWQKRDEAEDRIESVVDQATRPLDGKRYYGGSQLGCEAHGEYPLLFEITPEIKRRLQVVLLPTGERGALEPRALAAKEFDKLQIPAIKKQAAEKQKAKARRGGAEAKESSGTKKLTAAELKHKREQRARQLRERIADWRHQWLKRLVAARMSDADWQVQLFGLWLATSPLSSWRLPGGGFDSKLRAALKAAGQEAGSTSITWKLLAGSRRTRFSAPTMRDYVSRRTASSTNWPLGTRSTSTPSGPSCGSPTAGGRTSKRSSSCTIASSSAAWPSSGRSLLPRTPRRAGSSSCCW